MIEPIVPSVTRVQSLSGDLLANAVRADVEPVVERLHISSTIRSDGLEKRSLETVGARYDLDDGAVELFV